MIIDSALWLAAASALVAGLAGSGHCIAMCGGMASLLGARRNNDGRPVRLALSYNAGRIASYTLGGALVGGLGQAFSIASGIGAAAAPLRLLAGILIVLAGLYLLTGKRIFAPLEKIGARAWQRIAPFATRQLQREGRGSVFALGLLWGWLPCGMSWSLLAVAAASANPLHGAVIMLAFGLGTLPTLMIAGLAGFRLRGLLQQTGMRRAAAVMLLLAGIWTGAWPLLANMHASSGTAAVEHHHHH